jgi:hypothetical protein
MYATASHHHMVAFGDSTIRNFRKFYGEVVKDAASIIPLEFLFPKSFTVHKINQNMTRANNYRYFANQIFNGGKNNEFVEVLYKHYYGSGNAKSVAKYSIYDPPLCPVEYVPGPLKSETTVPYVMWIKQSYEVLYDPLIEYVQSAQHVCTNSKPRNMIMFVLSAGLHYLPVSRHCTMATPPRRC